MKKRRLIVPFTILIGYVGGLIAAFFVGFYLNWGPDPEAVLQVFTALVIVQTSVAVILFSIVVFVTGYLSENYYPNAGDVFLNSSYTGMAVGFLTISNLVIVLYLVFLPPTNISSNLNSGLATSSLFSSICAFCIVGMVGNILIKHSSPQKYIETVSNSIGSGDREEDEKALNQLYQITISAIGNDETLVAESSLEEYFEASQYFLLEYENTDTAESASESQMHILEEDIPRITSKATNRKHFDIVETTVEGLVDIGVQAFDGGKVEVGKSACTGISSIIESQQIDEKTQAVNQCIWDGALDLLEASIESGNGTAVIQYIDSLEGNSLKLYKSDSERMLTIQTWNKGLANCHRKIFDNFEAITRIRVQEEFFDLIWRSSDNFIRIYGDDYHTSSSGIQQLWRDVCLNHTKHGEPGDHEAILYQNLIETAFISCVQNEEEMTGWASTIYQVKEDGDGKAIEIMVDELIDPPDYSFRHTDEPSNMISIPRFRPLHKLDEYPNLLQDLKERVQVVEERRNQKSDRPSTTSN